MRFEQIPSQPLQPDNDSGEGMTPEELEFEEQLVRNWWESTLDGSKASSLFNTTWEVIDEYLVKAREKGLEIVPYTSTDKTADDSPMEIMYVAQPKKFTELLSEETLHRLKSLGLGDRLDKVLAEIGEKSIGQTMVFLHAYERKDDEYEIRHNRSRPEIAALTGLGLGYPACDVEYYIRTVYMGEKPYPDEQVDPKWGHGLCPDHSNEELKRQQQ